MSLQSLKQEAEMNSCDDQVWLRLARFYYQQANWQEAIAAYERVVEIRHQYAAEHYDPNSILVVPSSSDHEECQNQILDQAFTYYQDTLEVEIEYAGFYLQYGYVLRDLLEISAAESALQKAIEINPELAEAILELGNIAYNRCNYSLAVQYFQEAIDHKPEYAEAYCNIGNCLALQGQFEDAIDCYEKAYSLNPDLPDLSRKLNQIYNRFVPRWHFPMMNDTYRNNCYEEALQKAVKPESVVLDIGSGSGLLALMAARAGAKQVYTCEKVKVVANMARQIVEANGYSQQITTFNKLSNDLQVGADLSEPADILVSEIFDVGLLAEYAVPSVRHAREHLLKPNAQIIPKSATVYAVLVDSSQVFHQDRVNIVSGFDLSLFNAFSKKADYLQLYLRNFEYITLCKPFEVFEFDFCGTNIEPESRNISVQITESGTCHAIVFWFRLWLDDEIYLDTSPFSQDTCWMQAVHVVDPPQCLESGQETVVLASHDTTYINLKFG
ncbi:tetratricopeptide repeat protein [Pseudanabaena sp. FACHB-723]|uniref:Tetratricopeptide repeat protein n=1 Tax=Pseudanabaena mucicola FACHB-723 TaxID=2692860 RepID=A0ABR7ZXX6_9CYAN|nr:tetratricopeptide repeat protein [Pseudanabaena mucicola FACHB-723]